MSIRRKVARLHWKNVVYFCFVPQCHQSFPCIYIMSACLVKFDQLSHFVVFKSKLYLEYGDTCNESYDILNIGLDILNLFSLQDIFIYPIDYHYIRTRTTHKMIECCIHSHTCKIPCLVIKNLFWVVRHLRRSTKSAPVMQSWCHLY